MKKKIALALLIVSILVCLFAISVSATEIGGIYYTFNSNNGVNTATVSTKNEKNCSLEIVSIPETVTHNGTVYTVSKIESSAFGSTDASAANQIIKEVTIPKTVAGIGHHAFRNCNKLEKVTILASSGSFTLSNAEFMYCAALKVVDMSESTGLTSIGSNAFTNCPSLETVHLPKGLVYISGNSFSGASKLSTVTFQSSLKEISGKQAFATTGIKNVTLPNGLEKLGNNIFQFATVETVIIPATVTSVGEHCFNNVKTLKYVIIANPDVSGYNSAMFYESSVDLIFFAGTEGDAKAFASRLSRATFTNFVSYSDYLKNPTITDYKDTIVYGTKNCTACGDLSNDEVKFQFKDYLTSMQEAIICSCGKTNVVKEYSPIMTMLGYSAKINGNKITISYIIKEESLKAYETITGKSLRVGAVAAIVADGTSTYNPVNDDLTAINEKTIVAPIDLEICYSFDFIISGFGVEHYERLLVMGAYVYNESEIYYVDAGGCNTYATPFTFNSQAK